MNKRQLAAIIESSDDAILSKTLDGNITSWNTSAELLFGYTAAEAVGRPITLIIPPERLTEERWILKRLSQGQRIDHYETERLRKDGQRLVISLTVSPIKDLRERVIGISTIARDITEHHQLEEALRNHAAQLQTLNRRKDEFLAMLSHELRNPLAPIRNAVHLLRRKGLSDAALLQWAHEVIERQVTHLSHLVDDLLEASRITTDKITLKKKPLALVRVIAQAVEASAPLIEAGKHTLLIELSPGIQVEGDEVRLVEVVTDLLDNAVKYSAEGTRIWLSTERIGSEVALRVKDEGMGLSSELLPQIFELFVQGERLIDRSQGGLGVGLAIVKKLVELHGGRVEAKSEGVGKGSEFVVWLLVLA